MADHGLPLPPEVAVDQTRRAYVRRCLGDIEAEHRSMINGRVLALGRHDAQVRALESRVAADQRRVLAAEAEDRAARLPAPGRGGPTYPPDDPDVRGRGPAGPAVVLAGCVLAGYLVDRGALSGLPLGFELIPPLALAIAIGQTLGAHTVGRLLRRACEVVDPDVLVHERAMIRALGVGVGASVVGLALLRSLSGTTVLTLVTFGVGAVAAVAATATTYLHTDVRLDTLGATARHLRRRRRRAARTERRLARARARRAAAAEDLRDGAAAVVAAVERVYAQHEVHLGGSEPAWLGQLRNWAGGVGLPYGPSQDAVA